MAELGARLERYPLAIEVYEEVAKASMDNNLLKFSVKGYLLNAGICRLCSQDAIGAGPHVDTASHLIHRNTRMICNPS